MRQFIVLILFLLALTTSAQARESTIRCPDLNTMHQSADAINDATVVNGNYMAVTAPFAIHTTEMGWFAVVYHISAVSVIEALSKARQSMREINTIENIFAEDIAGIYVCRYDHGKIEVINNDDDWRRYYPGESFK